MPTAEQTLSWIKACLTGPAYKKKYKVDKSSNTLITEMKTLKKPLKSAKIHFRCTESFISVRAYVNVLADKKQRQSVAEYITRVNTDTVFCKFNMDFDSGEIWTDISLRVINMESLPIEEFYGIYFPPVQMLDIYGAGLLDVMSGEKSPKEARDEMGQWYASWSCKNNQNHNHNDTV